MTARLGPAKPLGAGHLGVLGTGMNWISGKKQDKDSQQMALRAYAHWPLPHVGQQESVRTRMRSRRRRSVVIEKGEWRSGRNAPMSSGKGDGPWGRMDEAKDGLDRRGGKAASFSHDEGVGGDA